MPPVWTPFIVLGAASLAACKGDPSPAPAPPLAAAVTVRDPDGATRLEARLHDGRCAVTGDADVDVDVAGEVATGRRGQTPIATLGPGRTGVELADGDGEPRIRVHRTPTRVELLGMDGVPLARLALEDRVARIVDAARRPVALLAREGGRITVTSPDGEALAYVAGTGDLEVAALLVTPGVDAEARAVLGCERLLASPGASTSAPAASRTP